MANAKSMIKSANQPSKKSRTETQNLSKSSLSRSFTKLKQDFLSLSLIGKLWLLAPLIMWFGYQPRIPLGGDATMNYELSLPLIYLVILALAGLPTIWRHRRELIKNKFIWLLAAFVVWTGMTVIWSPNHPRAILTFGITGILYLICLAAMAERTQLKQLIPTMIKILVGSAVVACVLAWGQMAIGTFNAATGVAGLCLGCMANQFGFVRPNLFTIEPQFLGSLLLAPTLIMYHRLIVASRRRWSDVAIFILLLTTLGLTLSRGAIYAFVLGAVAMWLAIKKQWRRKLTTVGLLIGSALLCLGIQGLTAAVNPNIQETFRGAVAKSVNQLSLGIVDFRNNTKAGDGQARNKNDDRSSQDVNDGQTPSGKAGSPADNKDATKTDSSNPVDKTSPSKSASKKAPNYDGYVAESTNVRVNLSQTALKAWASGDLPRRLFGTGLGSAGIELAKQTGGSYQKEIVQNEFVEVLLERGVIGLLLLVSLIIAVFYRLRYFRWTWAIVVTYLLQFCFFSGLPNALHVYAVLIWLMVL